MKVGIIAVHMDPRRGGRHPRGVPQPQIGPLIAGLLPGHGTSTSSTTPGATRTGHGSTTCCSCPACTPTSTAPGRSPITGGGAARNTVLGGVMASTYPSLCAPWFDAVAVGDPETTVPRICDDFCRGRLERVFTAGPYAPDRVPVPRLELVGPRPIC